MALLINLRHLEKKTVPLQGTLTAEELELVDVDEIVRMSAPLEYDLTAQKMGNNVLVQGKLRAPLECECARCLAPVQETIQMDDWVCNLALEGEEKVEISGDLVDLTPFVREDILLAFPQHPLCKPECGGLLNAPQHQSLQARGADLSDGVSSAWAELNKLKF